MDIAALSISLAQNKLSQDVGVSLVKLVQDQSSGQAQQFVQSMMERSVQPHLGGNLDLSV